MPEGMGGHYSPPSPDCLGSELPTCSSSHLSIILRQKELLDSPPFSSSIKSTLSGFNRTPTCMLSTIFLHILFRYQRSRSWMDLRFYSHWSRSCYYFHYIPHNKSMIISEPNVSVTSLLTFDFTTITPSNLKTDQIIFLS